MKVAVIATAVESSIQRGQPVTDMGNPLLVKNRGARRYVEASFHI